MPLEKLNGFTKKVQDLADKPNATMSAAEVKAQFDAAPDEVRQYLNTLIDDLTSVVDGDSGADNIGATAIAGLSGATVQAILESLKALDDENREYLLEQIQGVVLGQIPDEAITQSKISPSNTSVVPFASDTGTANAKVVALSPAPTAYAEGMAFAFKNLAANTGAVTVTVNGLGAVPVVKSNGNALTSGNLKAGSIYTVRKGTTSFILQGEGASGNAVASDLLSGKTAGSDAGDLVGTIVNRVFGGGDIAPNHYSPAETAGVGGTLYVRPNGVSGSIPTAYTGDIWLAVRDPNFIASNIKQGTSIFGVAGALAQGATGTVTSTANLPYTISVRGLAFVPKAFDAFLASDPTGYYMSTGYKAGYSGITETVGIGRNGTSTFTNRTPIFYSDGFDMVVERSGSYTWSAR